MPNKNNSGANSNKQYEDLGKAIAEFYENGYLNKRTSLKMAFLKGIVGGLGGVIGATIVVALFVWILSLFSNISLLEPFTESVQDTLQPTN